MPSLENRFIQLMLECDVLRFGDFVTKSGRNTPYFINSGNFSTGKGIAQLANCYADKLIEVAKDQFNNLYGPAYKGIPLCATVAMALYNEHGYSSTYTFNRKEAKDHGEKGIFVGHKYQGNEQVVIIEDVITAGTSIRESIPLLKEVGIQKPAGIIVSVDRMEKGESELSALQEVEKTFNLPVYSIVNINDIIQFVANSNDEYLTKFLPEMKKYREKYGIDS
ncbi:MAG: orotate phosphoribosyltransferase [Lentisphaeria bacterium]|nr:orotate phosphoribosyltransferase [Lentisphaeria bacterium]